MNKEMILAILVAYKAFNDKSLTVATDDYVVNFAVIDSIDDNIVSLLSYANDDNYIYNLIVFYLYIFCIRIGNLYRICYNFFLKIN